MIIYVLNILRESRGIIIRMKIENVCRTKLRDCLVNLCTQLRHLKSKSYRFGNDVTQCTSV